LTKVRSISFLLVLLWGVGLGMIWPGPAVQATGEQKSVTVGMFASSVFDLDFYQGTFTTIFWVWYIFDNAEYDPLDRIEIVNARDYSVMESYRLERNDGRYYVAAKMKAVINQPWDISKFPFDRQNLNIILESVGNDATEMRFVADSENSVNSPDLHLSGWKALPISGEPYVFKYNTNFGEDSPTLISFPRIKFSIPLQRDNPKLFFGAYIGYLIAFLMCAAIWMTAAKAMAEHRIGLILAATFAAIGNKNVLDSNYPTSPKFGFSDQLELSTFLLIAITLFLSVGCDRLTLKGRSALSENIYRYAFPCLLIGYIVVIATSLLNAISGG
jgi:hypothetical protein